MTPSAPAQYEAWRARELPAVERLDDATWSIPVPMPGFGLRYLLVYVLALDDGLAVIDTGWRTEQAWQALVAGLDEVGADVGSVRTVVLTHAHTDHYGLVERLVAASGARVVLDAAEAAVPDRAARASWWAAHADDVDPDFVATLDAGPRGRSTGPAHIDEPLLDGELAPLPGRRLRVVRTPGHSPGHVCLLDEDSGRLFAGDHVLPKISPNVTCGHASGPDPLGAFLDSLARTRAVAPSVTEVLPAHEYRYGDLAARCDELTRHHHERLAELAEAVVARPGATCWELAQALSWSRPLVEQPPALRRSAALETLAHLVRLQAEGRCSAHRTAGRGQVWGPAATGVRA